jgi:hypothetical protein
MSEEEKENLLHVVEETTTIKESVVQIRTDFYVYIHYTNELLPRPFYCGKGCGDRAHRETRRTNKWKNTMAKYGVVGELLSPKGESFLDC